MPRTHFLAAVIGVATGSAAFAQSPGNANVPRTQYIATMDTEFRKMDGDKDGQVTRAEVEAFDRGTAVARSRARAQAMFNQLDTDRNGQLAPAEFNRMVTAPPAVDGRPLIGMLDSNKDGRISLVEHRAGKLTRFDQIDLDKDGVVSVAEMKSAGVIK